MSEYYEEEISEVEQRAERGAALRKIVRENKFYTVVIAAMFIWLPFITIMDINAVHDGTAKSATVLAPIAWIYMSMGYWPAVLFIPAFYGVLITYCLYKMFRK